MLTYLVAFISSDVAILQRLNKVSNVSWPNRKIHHLDGESPVPKQLKLSKL